MYCTSKSAQNVFGIARYSKDKNGSQEKMFEESKIQFTSIFVYKVSGYNSNLVVEKIIELLNNYNHITIVVTELDRITRQPSKFVDLVNFVSIYNKILVISELSTRKSFTLNMNVYENSIKEKIEIAYAESKAKADRNRNRANLESYCRANLKQSIAYACSVNNRLAGPTETSRILARFNFKISPATISSWRKKYPYVEYCNWLKIGSINYRVPDYHTLLQNTTESQKKILLQAEIENIRTLVKQEYELFGLTEEVVTSMCEEPYSQNLVYEEEEELFTEEEINEIVDDMNHKMKKVSIGSSENEKDLIDYLTEDFENGNISQTQYLNFVAKIGKDVPKGDLISYIYSLKSNGIIEFSTYQYLTEQL